MRSTPGEERGISGKENSDKSELGEEGIDTEGEGIGTDSKAEGEEIGDIGSFGTVIGKEGICGTWNLHWNLIEGKLGIIGFGGSSSRIMGGSEDGELREEEESIEERLEQEGLDIRVSG